MLALTDSVDFLFEFWIYLAMSELVELAISLSFTKLIVWLLAVTFHLVLLDGHLVLLRPTTVHLVWASLALATASDRIAVEAHAALATGILARADAILVLMIAQRLHLMPASLVHGATWHHLLVVIIAGRCTWRRIDVVVLHLWRHAPVRTGLWRALTVKVTFADALGTLHAHLEHATLLSLLIDRLDALTVPVRCPRHLLLR